MSNLIVLNDFGQMVSEYIKNNLIPNWVSFVTQFAASVIMVLVVFFGHKPELDSPKLVHVKMSLP